MEDDRDDARLTQGRLEDKGFQVDIAGDGERGLAMLETGTYDALLVKYRLAGIDGLQVLRILGIREPRFSTVMVIGVGDEAAGIEAMKLGAVDCVVKDAAGEYLERLPTVIERAIEKRQRAEGALGASQARLSRAQGIAHLGYWEWSADDDDQCWSEETYRILGLDSGPRLPSHAAFIARLHGDDREYVLQWIAAVIAGTHTPGIEFRVLRPDGMVRWVRALGETSGDDEDRKSRFEGTLQDITEHRMILDKTRHEHLLLRNAVESLSGGFSLYDADDRLVICNENMRRTFPGMTDVLRPGMPFETVMRTFVERGLAPTGDADPEEWIQARLERHRQAGLALEFQRPDGRWIQINEYRTADGGIASVRTDITERKQTEEALQESEATLRTLIDSGAADVLVLLDREGRIQAANDRAASGFGLALADLIGRRAADLLPADVARKRLDWFEEVLATGRPVLCEDVRDGRWFDSVYSPVTAADGRVVAVAVMAHDVTERRRAEEELRRAREEAAAADTAKSEFLARMSHDMRVPLNSILGFSEMIGAEMLGSVENRKYVEYGRDIHASGTRLLSLLNDIVDISKIEAGKFEISDDAVDVAAVVQSTARLIDPQARAAALALEVGVMPALPPVQGDRNALTRIVENLLSNAVRFTPGGGTIRLTAAVEAAGSMIVQISDTGIGIAEADIPKALTPFGQIGSGEINGASGAGLGLPIVRHLVQLHDGDLELESTPGAGTTVTVRLPAARVLARSS